MRPYVRVCVHGGMVSLAAVRAERGRETGKKKGFWGRKKKVTQLFLAFVVGTREATLAGSRERCGTAAWPSSATPCLSASELWLRPLPGGRVDDAATFCSPAFKHLMNVQAALGDPSWQDYSNKGS